MVLIKKMNKPLVVEYLKTHSFRELEEEHGVKARPSVNYDKFSLNYDQIAVKSGDLLAGQCRGLIVRPVTRIDCNLSWNEHPVGNVEVVTWPMNRFYNLGDPSADQINWRDPSLRVYEKLDGTMIVAYWDSEQERWHAATRSVSEADIPICSDHIEIGNMTFSDLFCKALFETYKSSEFYKPNNDLISYLSLFEMMDKSVTYVFELTSQYNRVVVKYNEPRVTLLAARHTSSGKELDINVDVDMLYIPRPKSWNISEPTAIAAFVDQADPSSLEGAVVCDSQFRRLKIKSKAWVLSSRAKDLVTTSKRSALEAIVAGTIDDVIPIVATDIGEELTKMQNQLSLYLKQVNNRFHDWRSRANDDRKNFAKLVVESGDWTTPYFQLLDGKGENANDWIVKLQKEGKLSPKMLDTLLELIKLV